jgi:hypothetical protein
MAGDYKVRFSRGHGAALETFVNVVKSTDATKAVGEDAGLTLSVFPSQWVEGHEVTVDACIEGTSDVIPHTEEFLVSYKRFTWKPATRQIGHRASGMCLTRGADTFTTLTTCDTSAAQQWGFDETAKGGSPISTFGIAADPLVDPTVTVSGSLATSARNISMLRVNVTVEPSSSLFVDGESPGYALWTYDNTTGFIRSALTGEPGLCLALRGGGVFNTGS